MAFMDATSALHFLRLANLATRWGSPEQVSALNSLATHALRVTAGLEQFDPLKMEAAKNLGIPGLDEASLGTPPAVLAAEFNNENNPFGIKQPEAPKPGLVPEPTQLVGMSQAIQPAVATPLVTAPPVTQPTVTQQPSAGFAGAPLTTQRVMPFQSRGLVSPTSPAGWLQPGAGLPRLGAPAPQGRPSLGGGLGGARRPLTERVLAAKKRSGTHPVREW